MKGLLQGRLALVTGSTSGIGLGIARVLSKHGADIILNGLDPPAVADTIVSDLKDMLLCQRPNLHNHRSVYDPGAEHTVRPMMRQQHAASSTHARAGVGASEDPYALSVPHHVSKRQPTHRFEYTQLRRPCLTAYLS